MKKRERAPASIAIVIPAYRAPGTIVGVAREAMENADYVIIVDDKCPDGTGLVAQDAITDTHVFVIFREKNGGVGAATKTGIAKAIDLGAEIVIKVDADGQMDQSYIPQMLEMFEGTSIELVKGNRFADSSTLERMPWPRLIGNAGLSLLVKLSSGYWSIVDPTNGFIAVRTGALRDISYTRLADRYFFEIDLLCALGLRHRPIGEFEMPAIYGEEQSSLSIRRVLMTFPGLLFSRFLKRILFNYLIVEINLGTLCGIIGLPLLIFSTAFGLVEWHASSVSGIPRTAGTVLLSLLLFMVGFQLTLQAIMFDVTSATRVVKKRSRWPRQVPLAVPTIRER